LIERKGAATPYLKTTQHTKKDLTMYQAPCAVESALNQYCRKQQSGEELLKESEKELYQRVYPLIDALREAISYHAANNDGGMDYGQSRDFVVETIGELL
jgi:hypothetical protein